MYQGDGSYRQIQSEYKIEKSLIEMLNIEKELVDKYNSSVRAIEIAKRNCMRTNNYIDDLNRIQSKLDEIRFEIKMYHIDKLGIKTDMPSSLYNK